MLQTTRGDWNRDKRLNRQIKVKGLPQRHVLDKLCRLDVYWIEIDTKAVLQNKDTAS
jgi:hypothetical protein